MKLHLPITLLLTVLGSFAVHAIELSDDYVQIELLDTGYLYYHQVNTSEDKYAFALQSDLAFSPTTNTYWDKDTPLVKGGDLIFTTTEGSDLVALKFIGSGYISSVFYNPKNLTFDTLSNLTFKDNIYDGAIYLNDDSGSVYIRNVDDGVDNPDIPDVVFDNCGGYNDSCIRVNTGSVIDISNNGTVIFCNNKASSSSGSGQAIRAYNNSSINISNNANVIFRNNASRTSLGYSSGAGAIYVRGDINLENNGSVIFEFNSSCSTSKAHGGAIGADSSVIIDNNSGVCYFNNNAADATDGTHACGGAIYTESSLSISNNSDVSFNKNKALADYSSSTSSTSPTSSGGAIYASGTININNNAVISFNGNNTYSSATSSKSDSVSFGGAIYADNNLKIHNNRIVSFTENYAEASSTQIKRAFAYGGAIYSSGSISIAGNDSVTFEKNYEKTGYLYRLRSVYMNPDSIGDNLSLSSKSGGSITFYDSVYMGNYSGSEVRLNEDYEDANNVPHKATGDIIFSGKYTEDHLKKIKGGTAGTTTEIANSRTSELLNTVNLYGGTLRVEDKAVLKTHAINVVAGSNATMKVSDATVDATGYDIKVNDSAVLVIGGTDGSSKITAKNINIEEGATLSLTRTEVVTENVAITLSSADSVSIYNDKIAGIVSSSNLNIAGGATLKADGAHLSMDGGILNFLATTENKTNLVLTLGAEYDPNSQIMLFSDVDTVKFLQDNITATTNSAMVTLSASDYFIGDWVNDKTILVYDNGNIYVSGVNVVIPEPATTTLSLLALAALAARRRRK